MLWPLTFLLAVLVAAHPALLPHDPANPLPPAAPAARLLGGALGSAALVAVALVLAAACAPVPAGLIAFAGLLPLLRGLRRLLSPSFRPEQPGTPSPAFAAAHPWRGSARRALAGWPDTLAVLAPCFATHTAHEVAWLAVAVPLVTGVAGAACLFVSRPLPGCGRALRPWALVLVGLLLMFDGGAFNWL